MKKNIFPRFLLKAVLPLCLLASCNYLDVMPPEQVGADDTMEDKDDVISFLNSCYHGVLGLDQFNYESLEQSTDEYVSSPLWSNLAQRASWNQLNGDNTPEVWNTSYTYIGQVHLFLREIARQNPLGMEEWEKTEFINEVNFLKAYYHYRVLEAYGPCAIMSEYPAQDVPKTEIPGRRHYDYCVDYIVGMFDDCVNNGMVPARYMDEWGRATSTTAKALKSRLLVQAASPLWNGEFPFPDWKNKQLSGDAEYDEKYGLELVSSSYDVNKWQRALEASLDALTYAEKEGERKLFDIEAGMILLNQKGIKLNEIYVPGVSNGVSAEGEGDPADVDFLQRVATLRIMMSSFEDEGNKEIIWGLYGRNLRRKDGNFPMRVLYSNNKWQHGYSANAPTLYSIEHFYTKDGFVPDRDPSFPDENTWFIRAGFTEQNRKDIINLHVNREPRFYAWIAYDGDDYAPRMAEGKPLILNMKSSSTATTGVPGNGWATDFNRNFSATGYLSKKWCMINQYNSANNNSIAGNNINYPFPIIRLAELYLNVAECYAALDQTENALLYLNPIRKRAGIPELTTTMITQSGMNIMDWVRNERFVELWGEASRFFDLRRWKIAPQQMKANAREGLNVKENVGNPSFEEFNRRTVITQPFQWEDRMYLMPVWNKEIYSGPKLIQGPNY